MKIRQNHTFKKEFLNYFLQTGYMPQENEWKLIYRYAGDKNPANRYDAAEVLRFRCNAEDETLLRQMTYDKNGLVRLNAIDSLEMGIQEESLNRMYELMSGGGRLTRGYAAYTFFDIWVNQKGYTRSSMEQYRKRIEELYKKETDPWVLSHFERNRYLSGVRDGIIALKNIICEAQDYHIQCSAEYRLMEMRTPFNEKEINRVFEEVLDDIADSCYLKEELCKVTGQKEPPKILVVDRENSGLSQMLEYIGANQTEDWYVASAGFSPASAICIEMKEQADEDCDLTRYYYPKAIRQLWRYDYIVPIGVKLREDEYPFQRIIRIFENEDESMTDLKKAEEMWKELSEFIKIDRKSSGGDSMKTVRDDAVSGRTLEDMDRAIGNFKMNKVSDPIVLSDV